MYILLLQVALTLATDKHGIPYVGVEAPYVDPTVLQILQLRVP